MIGICGEAVLDLLPDGTSVLAGSPFNVASGLGRLGVPVAYLGALSSDHAGAAFRAALGAAGISVDLVQLVARPTLCAEVSIRAGEVSYRFEPADSADRHFAPPEAARVGALAGLHVGSLSLGREPGGTVIEKLALSFDGFLSIDPNVRPVAIEDPLRWRARVLAIAARADVVKLSTEDAALLFPERDERLVVEELLDLGAASVALTKGADGASWYLSGGSLGIGAPAPITGDAVGAGDSFMAGLLAGIEAAGALRQGGVGALNAAQRQEVLELACATAAITCAHLGAYAPSRAEVAALARR